MISLRNIYESIIYDPLDKNDVLKFLQPELNPDGTCPIFKKAGEYYDLRKWHKDSTNLFSFVKSLKLFAESVQKETNVGWFGIYILKNNNLLVKYAYAGEFSKAEFPVTAENLDKSVNANVAYYKKTIHIENVDQFDGPYYRCDAKVKSELCIPILSEDKCIGIIDCEDHRPGFFLNKIEDFIHYASDLKHFILTYLPKD